MEGQQVTKLEELIREKRPELAGLKPIEDFDIQWPEENKEALCCHDVLAMLSGKSIEEILELSKTIGMGGTRLSAPCMLMACRELGFKVSGWGIYKGFKYVGNPFPVNCIISTWLNDGKNYEVQPHVILRIGNAYYDPYYRGKKLGHWPANQTPTVFAEILGVW